MDTNISTAKQGMITDIPLTEMRGNQYTFALNAGVESNSQDGNMYTIQNDSSNILYVKFPEGFIVIGKVRIHEQRRTIYTLVNQYTGQSIIGETLNCLYNDDSDDIDYTSSCEDCDFLGKKERKPLEDTEQIPYCQFHTIITSDCLNFDINYPVQIEYKVTDCSLNIYFTDDKNQRRYIYFDYEGGVPSGNLILNNKFKVINGRTSECNEPMYINELDCNKIKYHPDIATPCIDLIDVNAGGSLKAGVYQFFVAYADITGQVLTDYTSGTNPVPVFSKYITVETGYPTDKAIRLSISGLDTTELFSYYNLVAANTVDNFTDFKLVGTFPTTQSEINYTGNEIYITLTADDVFARRVFYETAGGIAKANDILFNSDLKEFKRLNLQRVANNIILYWKTVAIPEAVYREPANTFKLKGYNRDEVYPIGIRFKRTTGEVLGPFHIPGPSKQRFQSEYGVNVDTVVSNNDVVTDTSCNGIDRNKLWQVYNIGRVIGTPHQSSLMCDGTHTWEWGEFSYWESIATYPNNEEMWGDLCGKPIRYHKFPDSAVTHIHDGLNGAKTFTDSNIVYPIGIKVDHQSVIDAIKKAVLDGIITQQDADSLSEYTIIRGNRVGNESIIAKGLLYDMWNYNKNDNTYYYSNYPYNDLSADDFISGSDSTYQGGNNSSPNPINFTSTRRYTFHSPNTHFRNPEIGTEIKLETEEYGTSEGYFNKCDEQAEYKFLSTASTLLSFLVGIASAISADRKTETKTIVTKNYQALNGVVPGVITTTPAIPGVQSPLPLITTSFFGESTPVTYGAILQSGDPFINPTGIQPLATEVYLQSTRSNIFRFLTDPTSGSPVAAMALADLQNLVYLGMLSMSEMEIMSNLLKSLIPYKNLSIQYNSIGKYNNYKIISHSGNSVREIDKSAYLDPVVQLINEVVNITTNQFTNVYINNWNRESTVYIKTDSDKPAFSNPSVTDNSRFTMDNAGLGYKDLNKKVYRSISSYYASIKRFIPDQYGHVTDMEYLETSECPFVLGNTYDESNDGVFGGDTFITRFGLKRKMPFFTQTRFRFQNDSDIIYSDFGNVGFPNYYFNTEEPILERIQDASININSILSGTLFQRILGVPQTRLDAKRNKIFYQEGYIHLYNYGIPYFLVESDVNCDFRYGENVKERDFYPHQQDLNFWLQEKNVPITEDNYYFYNKSYSKQNKEGVIGQQDLKKIQECKVDFPSRIIYSEKSYNNNDFDNWLIFKANNYYDAPASFGRVTGLDGIENDKVVVRFENTSQIFNAYDVLNTDQKDIQVGNAGMFQTRPREFSSVDLGYAGSQHRSMLKTEFSHIWVDAKRGQIFSLSPNASGMDELCKYGRKAWFKENLPFQLLRDFPNIEQRDLDNNFKGIGIVLSFDKRYNRVFVTKLDYKRLDKKVIYNPVTKTFQKDGKDVHLTDKKYFCNKSWTTSFNFATKSWVSIHSFTPNYYIDDVDFIDSGINDFSATGISSTWSHNITNKSFQVYYGKPYPFSIEIVSNAMLFNNILNSVEYETDVLRYHNNYDNFLRDITFNKAYIYNDRQCSGMLELIPRDENNLFASLQYPQVDKNSIQILVTNRDNKWRFNQFYDAVNSQSNNLPFIVNTCNNADKELVYKAFNYFKPDIDKQLIRGRQTRIRLINDKYTNYKFIFRFAQQNKTPVVG